MNDTPDTDQIERLALKDAATRYSAMAAHARGLERKNARLDTMANRLLAHLDDGTHESGGECSVCSVICCPHEEPLHFHHDGCPACDGRG